MDSISKEKYFIWFINGGLGKNVAATSLVKTIKQTYPDRKLIMCVSWPQVFINNPYVDRVFALGQTPYFYEDYIKGKDIIISKHEPYEQTGHVTKKKHLIENWCDLMNLEYKDQQPQLFFNYAEQKAYAPQPSPKPILLINTGGGPLEDKVSYNWTRDIPMEFASAIVDKYSQTHNIVQLTRPNGYRLEHPSVKVINQQMSNLNLFSLLQNTSKRILIDSCLQHAAAAMNLPSTVLWIGTSPTLFGYKKHKNILANPPKIANQLVDSTFYDYAFQQNEWQCPYMEADEIFSQETLNKL